MITNEHQYELTKMHAKNFERALEKFNESCTERKDLDPLHRKAVRDSLCGQIESLRHELEEYENLTNVASPIAEIAHIDELRVGLIRARIIAQVSQQELAEKLGMDTMRLVKHEVDAYSEIEFYRLLEIAEALNVKVSQEIRSFCQGNSAESSATIKNYMVEDTL